MRPELHQLAVFLKAAETRSFTAAAQSLGCSQPAVSQTIRRLEDIYGGDLFARRAGAPLALTPIGEAILPSARTILDAVEQQMASATFAARGLAGSITIGSCLGFSARPLRSGLQAFAAAAPAVRLHFREGSPSALLAGLPGQKLDLVIAPAQFAADDTRFAQELLWRETLMAVVPAGHSLADDATIGWNALLTTPLLLPDWLRDDVLRTLPPGLAGAIKPFVRSEAPTIGVSLDFVATGLGTSIVTESAAWPRRDVLFRPLTDPCASIVVAALWRRDDANPSRHRLLGCIRNHKGDARAGPPPAPTDQAIPAGPDRD